MLRRKLCGGTTEKGGLESLSGRVLDPMWGKWPSGSAGFR